VIASGTTDDQRTVVAALAEIAEASSGLEPPALVVVGDVVDLAPLLDAAPPVALPFEATDAARDRELVLDSPALPLRARV
jgi:siroheme synthase